jgi:hypothetical protein
MLPDGPEIYELCGERTEFSHLTGGPALIDIAVRYEERTGTGPRTVTILPERPEHSRALSPSVQPNSGITAGRVVGCSQKNRWMTDNAGATAEHRSLNYLAMRYPGVYAKAAKQFGRDFALSGVEVRLSPVSATRTILEVIFSYTKPQYRLYGKVLCSRGCDRGVPVPRHETSTVL